MIRSVRQPVEHFLRTYTQSHNLSLYFNRLCIGIDERGQQEQKNNTIAKMISGFSEDNLELYRKAFHCWRKALEANAETLCFEMACATPLSVGRGDHSVHEFGISLQLPWATPVIPGSGIKGMLSAWAHENGTDAWKKSAWCGTGGEHAVYMFGGRDPSRRSRVGMIDFLDAWWVPSTRRPFKEDIINVHYKSYYQGTPPGWPDGTDSPIPNKFVVVQPGERFLFALRGPVDWCALAKKMIVEASGEIGFGGKTRVGYGLFDYCKSSAEWLAEIPDLDDRQLSELYEKEKNNAALHEAFAAESRKRTMNDRLRDLFIKYRPAAALLAELETQKPATLKDARSIRDRYASVLPNKQIDPADPDIHAIFNYCLASLSGVNPAGTWLAAFQYGPEHLITDLSAEEIQAVILSYSRSFPPLESFKAVIENRSDLSKQEIDECLEWLAEKIKERDGR